MLEMICAIPEPIGWILVGYLIAWVGILAWRIGKILYLGLANDKEEDF